MKKTMNKNYHHRYSAMDVMNSGWITNNALEKADPYLKEIMVVALRNCRKAIYYGLL